MTTVCLRCFASNFRHARIIFTYFIRQGRCTRQPAAKTETERKRRGEREIEKANKKYMETIFVALASKRTQTEWKRYRRHEKIFMKLDKRKNIKNICMILMKVECFDGFDAISFGNIWYFHDIFIFFA